MHYMNMEIYKVDDLEMLLFLWKSFLRKYLFKYILHGKM